MNRRATLSLTGATLLGLAIAALPQYGFTQGNQPARALATGLFQLNLAKSKFSPGPPPKSQTVDYQGEGQNRRGVVVAIDAEGNPVASEQVDGADCHSRGPMRSLRGLRVVCAHEGRTSQRSRIVVISVRRG